MRTIENGPSFVQGGGEMGMLIRAHDWAATPLGPPNTWPQVLRTLTNLMLNASQPMFLVWGPKRTTIYNDAYGKILAGKHPAVGQPFDRIWHEIWDSDLKPIVTRAYAGEALHMDDIQLQMLRKGYPEETHFSFSYTPVQDTSGVVQGFFCPCLEITEQVLEKRRATLRAAVTERLRAPGDPAELTVHIAGLLANHLQADQAAYAEVEESGEYCTIGCDWNDGRMTSNAGRHRLQDFGPGFIADLRNGLSVAIGDVRGDPRTATPQALPSFESVGVRAFLNIPHIRHGRLAAVLAINCGQPRQWHPADIALAEEVAERVAVTLERVRAEAALRESEMRLRKVMDIKTAGIVFFDLVGGIQDANDAFLEMIGYSRTELEAGELRYENLTPKEWHWRDKQTISELRAGGKAGPFEKQYTRKDGSLIWILCADKMLDESTAVEFVIDVTDRKRAEEYQDILMAELDHRVKNILAVVQSIARQSLMKSDLSGPEAAERLVGRISALARSHTLLASSRWQGAAFRDLVEDAAAPHRGESSERIIVEGPDLRVTAKAAQTLTLALHELMTNAAKYGALSTKLGRVTIKWEFRGEGDRRRLILDWQERGGPQVEAPPRREGFGSRLIKLTLTYELEGEVRMDFARDGLRAVADLPLDKLSAEGRQDIQAIRRREDPAVGDQASLVNKRVLVVEDEHFVAQETAETLRSAGCHVIGPISNLTQAMRTVTDDDLDAAVVDINLGGDLVWPAAEVLRSRRIPFVFTTGYAGTIRPPQDLAQVPWVEKPLQRQRLLEVLAAAVGTKTGN